ncbi:hypothetical protein E8E13_006785 [Curvularia kusanoi]|uniref:Uncharacterized protein n=1 Tax=Curvularia kusanoi TaxID=90978 RepID=A0A9P4TPN1_CURKU|nr:hypothetical protein E8E13_006785 [Curvularia kusanoi]
MATQLITVLAPDFQSSQRAPSVTDAVVVPNPTPLPEALSSEAVDPPPDIDVHAMIKILEPIAETLNEAAMEAMYPTPPINTPAVGSPAASVINRHPRTRSQGMSTIGDRLARAKIDSFRYAHRDYDIFSNSGHSVLSSSPEDDSEIMSDVLGEGEKGRHESSPRINPISLISFTSNDLADKRIIQFNGTAAIEGSTATLDTAVNSGSLDPDSSRSAATGVTEMSTWKEDVETEVERALQRLENLANDEQKLDPSKPTEHYYEAHVRRLLAAPTRKFPVTVVSVEEGR